MSSKELDYEELGLKIGLEFHQRLDTHKLFCECESKIKEEDPEMRIERQLRPSAGELGEIDPAAMKEALKGKKFIYDIYRGSTCLVETDSEPPHSVDREAFELSLTIAKMLNCEVYDEINFMRKTVIDGSNTTGFQRTAMIGHDGHIDEPVKVDIEGVFLEEESAGIVGEIKGEKEYRLDRLGIPLVEIATGIVQTTPEKIKEAALRIGLMLRTTGKVKRGLGTIRQDLNISIEKGNRVEVKGLQEIGMMEEIVENEVRRQLGLVEVKEELEKRSIEKVNSKVKDFTRYFRKEAPAFIGGTISNGGGVYGYVLPKFKGILGKELLPNHRFGTELAEIAKSMEIPGIIHTDEEMSRYGIEDQIKRIKEDEEMKEDDSLLLISSQERKAKEVLGEIKKRINQAVKGVPQETRRALENGYTQYLRPLGGRKRMYPETDIPTVRVTEEDLKKAESRVPLKPEEIVKKLQEEGMSRELAEQAIKSYYFDTIREIIDKTGVDPTLIASTFTSTLKELKNKADISKLDRKHFKEIFRSLEEGKFPKDALKEVIKEKANDVEREINKIIEERGLKKLSEEKLRKEIKKRIEENKELIEENERRAFKVMIGEMMKDFKGKVNGKTISKMLKEELEKLT